MQSKHLTDWMILVVFSLALVACAPPATPTAAPATTLPPTATATATLAPSPTSTLFVPTVAPTPAPTPTPTETAVPTPAAKEVKVGVSQATSVVVDYNAKDLRGYTTANTQEAKPGSEVTLVVKDGKYVTFQGFVQVKTADGKTGFVPQDTLAQLPQLNEKNSDELTAYQVQSQMNIPRLRNFGVDPKTSPASIAQWIAKEDGKYAFQNNLPEGLEAYEYAVSGHLLGVTHDTQGNLVFTIQGKEPTDIRKVTMVVSPDKPMTFQTQNSNKSKQTSVFFTTNSCAAAEIATMVFANEYNAILAGSNKGVVFVGSTLPYYSQRAGNYWGVVDFSR